MTRIVVAGLAIVTLAAAALAQAPPRRPGPEHTRLGTLVGRWNLEGDSQGMAYKMSETCDWFAGGFHLVCRREGAGAMGDLKGESIIGYDAREKVYTFYTINNLGIGIFAKGIVTGEVWTWVGDVMVEGGVMNARFTISEQSPTSYSYKMEGSLGGSPWQIIELGKAMKAQ